MRGACYQAGSCMARPLRRKPVTVCARPDACSFPAAATALLLAAATPAAAGADPAAPDAANPLSAFSIEELADVRISSVSKSSERLADAAAAVFVITREDIARSGATTIPEILRLAPNLEVATIDRTTYAISARGFNGDLADKLLVLIDGRTVYSPLYGGVYWDMQGVPPENIERIEVISGPGATLWGANAENGVINIITRTAGETQGTLLTAAGGNADGSAGGRYGGRLAPDLAYRIYALGFEQGSSRTDSGANAQDAWSKRQGGFRVDWTPHGDAVTVQGDIYRAPEEQPGAPELTASGRNLLGRWEHQLGGASNLQVQAYYDDVQRFSADAGGGFWLKTYDLEVQHSFQLGSRNDVIWGAGERITRYDVTGVPELLFAPASRTLHLSDVFIEDAIRLADRLKLTLGLKVEDEPFSGVALLPSARLSMKVDESTLLWSAVSRAVRSPTPFDTDLVEKSGPTVFLTGSPDFRPEKVTAYEIGTRLEPAPRLSVSLSTFYNDYDDLRSIELAPNGTILPLHFGNLMLGDTYGAELWQATGSMPGGASPGRRACCTKTSGSGPAAAASVALPSPATIRITRCRCARRSTSRIRSA
jgi:iron complex outermembrane recepter protein